MKMNMDLDDTFEPLSNPNSPLHNVHFTPLKGWAYHIWGREMSETKRGYIVVEQSFSDSEYFDALKEFEIIKNFDLEHIK